MQRLGFSLQEHYAVPITQVVDLVADVGFDAMSLTWQRGGDCESIIRQAKQKKLTVQSLHGPVRGMPAAWSTDPDISAPLLQDLLQAATDCAKWEIPLLVVHPWNGVNYSFDENALYFHHFDALVNHAEKLGIIVAFENLEGPEYLAALMERYRSSRSVGFCWDSGHERCYAPGWDFLRLYGDRLVMTHLNDNLGISDPSGRLQGTDDLHMLPYHGILDWKDTVHRLQSANRQEILNFELKIRPKGDRCKLDLYSKFPLRQYLEDAYTAACRAIEGYFA